MTDEALFTKDIRPGDTGPAVKHVQEWLTYHGFGTAIDGEYGPATERCVKNFQLSHPPPTGVVDAATFALLVAPLVKIRQPIPVNGRSLREMVLQYARQHADVHPIEIGGENRGVFVREYMAGNEGTPWPWCAGFATYVLRQACKALGVSMPHPYAFGCDFLAGKAQAAGSFLRPKSKDDLNRVRPGWLFLIRKGDPSHNAFQHIGVVDSITGDTFSSIEGNTNTNGSSNGYEVARLTRSLANKDFLVV